MKKTIKQFLLITALLLGGFFSKAQIGIVITSENNSFVEDYGSYVSGFPSAFPKVVYQKNAVTYTAIQYDSSNIQVFYTDGHAQNLTWNQSNTDPALEIVKTVNGIVPTSQLHLYNLLKGIFQEYYNYTNISSSSTVTSKTGPGVLQGIVINKTASLGSITIYDNTAGSGTKIGTITFPLALLASQTQLLYNVAFKTGLTVVVTGSIDITITWI